MFELASQTCTIRLELNIARQTCPMGFEFRHQHHHHLQLRDHDIITFIITAVSILTINAANAPIITIATLS